MQSHVGGKNTRSILIMNRVFSTADQEHIQTVVHKKRATFEYCTDMSPIDAHNLVANKQDKF